MKSEELFFEDLNFFRFFFSAAAKKRSSFSPLFFHPLFRFFFLFLWDEQPMIINSFVETFFPPDSFGLTSSFFLSCAFFF